MARVAVVHNTLDFRGGADAVALSVCAALDSTHGGEHDVDLVTVSETDPGELAPKFGLDVDVSVREPPGAEPIARGLGAVTPYVGPQLAARSALVSRFFRRHAADYDLAVSTTNEIAVPIPSIQYVHFPQFHLDRLPERFDRELDRPGRLWNRLWSWIAAPSPPAVATDVQFVANSEWTADAVAGIYGCSPEVVYPPVRSISDPLPWTERDPGIVVVGRLAPDRRVLEAIEVVDRTRAAVGADRTVGLADERRLHLHIVGTAPRSYRQYVERVREQARKRPYVHLETDVPRERLAELLRTHRYGLNVKPIEPFGIGVAEFVAAGMIAFAPDAGGQQEVLDGRSDRLFGSIGEAVELLTEAIDSGDRPQLPRERFSPERFKTEIRRHVATALDRD